MRATAHVEGRAHNTSTRDAPWAPASGWGPSSDCDYRDGSAPARTKDRPRMRRSFFGTSCHEQQPTARQREREAARTPRRGALARRQRAAGRGRPRADGVGAASVTIAVGPRPHVPRTVRACAGGSSARAATTRIRAAAHGASRVFALSSELARAAKPPRSRRPRAAEPSRSRDRRELVIP